MIVSHIYSQVEVTVNHTTTGSMGTEITSALGTTAASTVTKLIVTGSANLNLADCQAVRDVFNTATFETLDLSQAKFLNDSTPSHSSDGAFNGMKMKTVVLPSTLKTIGKRTFKACTEIISDINLPEGLIKIDEAAFASSTKLKLTSLPSTLKTINGYAFHNCSPTTITTLPAGLEGTIGTFAFSGTKVSVSVIPDKVTAIGSSAFAGTSTSAFITSLVLPVGLTTIGTKAFNNQPLTGITLKGTNPPTTNIEGTFADGKYTGNHCFSGVVLANISVHVPVGAASAYNVKPWNEMKEIIADGEVIVNPANPQIITTTFDGRTRQYLVYKPVNSLNRNPDGLMVTCHGMGGKMENAYTYAGFNYIANQLNMILISPQALPEEDQSLQNTANNIGYDLTAAWGQVLYVDASYKVLGLPVSLIKATLNNNVKDTAFIHSIVQTVSNQYSVNKRNTFIAGISMGGFMSYAYATRYGNELAGLINIVGSMGLKLDTTNVNVSLPILDFHSTTDGTVFYYGEGDYASAQNIYMKNAIPKLNVLDYWARKNGANRTPVVTTLATNPNNGVTYKKYYYDHPTKEITHYQLTGAAHSYSVSLSNGDPVSHSTEAKNFIIKHMNQITSDNINIEQSSLTIYPTVTKDMIFIRGVDKSQQVSVYDMFGRQMDVIKLQPDALQTISMSHLPKGIYILKTQNEVFKFCKN